MWKMGREIDKEFYIALRAVSRRSNNHGWQEQATYSYL